MVLELSGNQLTRVDDFIESMTMLKELDLSGNLLNHVSDAIGLLPNLEVRVCLSVPGRECTCEGSGMDAQANTICCAVY